MRRLRASTFATSAVLFAFACSPVPRTTTHRTLHLVIVGGASADVYLKGARAWEALDFVASFADSGHTECARHWYEDSPTCQLTIGIVRDPTLRQREGTTALSDRDARTIRIDSSVTEFFALLIAVAHEVGHIVLDTPLHTQGGIMGGSAFTMTDVDRQLACTTVHVCLGASKRP